MKPGQSLYSIIQFRPRRGQGGRRERWRGVVCPSKNAIKAAFSSNNVAVQRRFGADVFKVESIPDREGSC
jgi:hypothetical protein